MRESGVWVCGGASFVTIPSRVTASKLQMEAEARYQHRAAIAVVPRVVNVLHIQRREDSSPHMKVVVALKDVFAPVIERAVTQQETQTTWALGLQRSEEPIFDHGTQREVRRCSLACRQRNRMRHCYPRPNS